MCDDEWPLSGNSTVKNVVCRATVTRSDNNTSETYTGSTYRTVSGTQWLKLPNMGQKVKPKI